MNMKKRIAILALSAIAGLAMSGCETTKGAVMGAGVGYIFGDAEAGAEIGATVGLIKDIWK